MNSNTFPVLCLNVELYLYLTDFLPWDSEVCLFFLRLTYHMR